METVSVVFQPAVPPAGAVRGPARVGGFWHTCASDQDGGQTQQTVPESAVARAGPPDTHPGPAETI